MSKFCFFFVILQSVKMADELQKSWLRAERGFRTYLTVERGMAGNSVASYLNDFQHLARLGLELGLEPTALDADHLRGLIDRLCDLGIAVTTQCRMISGWRMFFHWLELEDEAADNPAELLTMPSRPKHLPDVLTDADVTAIQETFDLSLPDQMRNYVMVEILYGCGLRVSELVGLRLSGIYASDLSLRVIGKGDKERWVPVNERAMQLLMLYVETVRCHINPKPGEDKYVFLSRLGRHLTRNYVFMFLKDAVAKAGIGKQVSPHSLRHSFATELVQNGADLRAVQEMLGHESITTTEIYTHLNDRTLRETIDTYHPHYRK